MNIKILHDNKTDKAFVPQTHVKAVIDDNGNSIDILLSKKQNTLISGTDIKTINGQPILGSGDITITEGDAAKVTELENRVTELEAKLLALETLVNDNAEVTAAALTDLDNRLKVIDGGNA